MLELGKGNKLVLSTFLCGTDPVHTNTQIRMYYPSVLTLSLTFLHILGYQEVYVCFRNVFKWQPSSSYDGCCMQMLGGVRGKIWESSLYSSHANVRVFFHSDKQEVQWHDGKSFPCIHELISLCKEYNEHGNVPRLLCCVGRAVAEP